MFRESTEPLLRHDQVTEMREEEQRLESTLSAPPHIATQIQDRPELQRHLRRLKAMLQQKSPTPYPSDQIDAAVKREAELREQIVLGMPTRMEMRTNPDGAVDKHTRWERRNKQAILEWKNIRRRLNHDSDAVDVANVETLRPVTASHELNMHNQQIPSKVMHLPPEGAALPVVMTAEQSAVLKDAEPELHGMMAVLTNEQRAEVLKYVNALVEGAAKAPPKKPAMSPEERKAWGAKMKKAREAKRNG